MKKKHEEKNIFKTLRIIRDIKATDLAKALNVSSANISYIEAGLYKPSKRLLPKYAQALGVTPEFINSHLSDSENMEIRYEEYLFNILNDLLYLDQEKKS